MTIWLDFLESITRVAAQGIINGIWQGIVLVLLMGVMLKLVSRTSAVTRHALWWSTLGILLVLPAIHILMQLPDDASGGLHGAGFPPAAGETVRQQSGDPAQSSWLTGIALPGGSWLFVILAAWVIVTTARCVRLVRGVFHLRHLKSHATALPPEYQRLLQASLQTHGCRRSVRFLVSPEVTSPMLLGLMNPAIVFPKSLLNQLTELEIHQLALHEIAHLRRRDDWSNLAFQIVEALFFLHPGVLWVGRQLHLEREIACDDWVVAATGRPRSYAASLTKLAELVVAPKSPALAAGAIFSQRGIVRRIDHLLEGNRCSSTKVCRRGVFVGLAVLLAVVIPLVQAPAVIAIAAEVESQVSENPSGTAVSTLEPEVTVERRESSIAAILQACRQMLEDCGSSEALDCRIQIKGGTMICRDIDCKPGECSITSLDSSCKVMICSIDEVPEWVNYLVRQKEKTP